MNARPMMLILAGALLLAPVAFAQKNAVSRDGGGGGESKGSSAHPSGGGGGGSDSSGAYKPSPGSKSGSGSDYGSPPSTAERRHPRAGTGHGGGGRSYGYAPGYPYYDSRYYSYSPGWGWGSYWWPYGSYGWYGSGGYWGYPYGSSGVHHYVHRAAGSIRVLVDPAEARVYVDGYYAGTVDDFDGLFQRLNVSPGRHEISLKLEGYRTHRLKVYAASGGTLKLHHDMVRGAGETFEDLAGNVPEREVRREPARDEEDDEAENEDPAQADDDAVAAGGKLRLKVSPADASVYVDGAFRGTAREAASLQLPPGQHRLELVRPGYRTHERTIEIGSGDAITVTIEMEKPSI
jgi:hypothetical protein